MFKKMIACLIGLVTLQGCSSDPLEKYAKMKPEADIKGFFTGPIKAWGIIQDWSGTVVSRFDVDMMGKWDGDKGVLEEDFRYYSGKTQKRIWQIEKLPNGKYKGTAADIFGMANGEVRGAAVNWHYRMNIPVGDSEYMMNLDDWMWQMNDDVMINRSYIKKFGFTVAELTLFMQKQKPATSEDGVKIMPLGE